LTLRLADGDALAAGMDVGERVAGLRLGALRVWPLIAAHLNPE